MLRNHLIITLRNLRKHKGYTFINVAGLAVGIAVCALLLLWVRDELAYDRFHEKADRTYRALWSARFGNNEWTMAKTPLPLADVLREQFPEVEQAVRFTQGTRTLRLGEDWSHEEGVLRVEKGFFDVFTVDFLSGDPKTALDDPNSIIVTEEAAGRYFPDQNAVGKSLEVNNGDVLRVTGVVKSLPPQSHFDFDFLVPLDPAKYQEWQKTDWGSPPVYTYFTLKEGATAAQVDAKLKAFITRNVLVDGGARYTEGNNHYGLPLQAMLDIHLRSNAEIELLPNGNITYVYLFSAVGAFILLLACINFINLATARAANRSKEVGVRKVLGSQRAQLIRQFMAESFVYVAAAVLLAVVLIELVLPAFNSFAGKALQTNYLGSPVSLLVLAGLATVVTVLAGAYPAFVLSAFRPVQALRGGLAGRPQRNVLRNGLVVLQFCISIGLILGTLIIQSQIAYVQNKRLGFDKEHVLVVQGAGALGKQYAAFRDRLAAHPLVASASSSETLPGYGSDSMPFEPEQPASYKVSSVNYARVDEHFVPALGVKLIAGRNFSAGRPADSSAFLINQAAAKAIGWKNPVGKTLANGGRTGTVIGVVEDFHYQSLHTEVQPIIFPFVRWTPSYLAVRLQPGRTAEAVQAVQAMWEEAVPQRPFDYTFLDQDYAKLYESEQRVGQVFGFFSVLALLIAGLGLFGLASYAAVQRTKEIGVRKVLGASVGSIVLLFTRDFARLVILASLLAAPLAYFAMSRWLEGFAYRTEIAWGLFPFAALAALALALLTVSYQALKAALADPVKSLRYE